MSRKSKRRQEARRQEKLQGKAQPGKKAVVSVIPEMKPETKETEFARMGTREKEALMQQTIEAAHLAEVERPDAALSEEEALKRLSVAIAQGFTDEKKEEQPDFDAVDRAILLFLQENIPLLPRPYEMLARQLHLREEDIISRIRLLKERGVIRRMGAVLNHHKAGFTVNALTAWGAAPRGSETAEEAMDRVGKILSDQPCVTHCYARETPPEWDWPLFAMVHATSEEDLESTLRRLMQEVGSEDVRILKTVREWKKTTMKYF